MRKKENRPRKRDRETGREREGGDMEREKYKCICVRIYMISWFYVRAMHVIMYVLPRVLKFACVLFYLHGTCICVHACARVRMSIHDHVYVCAYVSQCACARVHHHLNAIYIKLLSVFYKWTSDKTDRERIHHPRSQRHSLSWTKTE